MHQIGSFDHWDDVIHFHRGVAIAFVPYLANGIASNVRIPDFRPLMRVAPLTGVWSVGFVPVIVAAAALGESIATRPCADAIHPAGH